MTRFLYDPGKVSPEAKKEIEDAPEHMLYFMINEAGAARFRSMHDSADARPWAPSIPESMRIEEECFHLQAHCIRQLHKFGVEKPLEDDNDTATQEYWNWFRGWDCHIKDMPAEDWAKFEKAMNTQDDDIKSVLRWYPDFAKERRENVPAETPERQDRFNAIDVEGGEPE
jgi:hypothetical protein